MSTTAKRRLATGLKWAARIFGLAGVVLYLAFLWGSGLSSQSWIVVVGQISFAIGMPLTLGGLIISWWKVRLAGILLTLSFASPLGLLIYSAMKNLKYDFSDLFFGLPSLIAGGLFLLSWWLSKKARSSV